MSEEMYRLVKGIKKEFDEILSERPYELVYFMNQSDRTGHLWAEATALSRCYSVPIGSIAIVLAADTKVASEFCMQIHESLGVRYITINKDSHVQLCSMFNGELIVLEDKKYIFGNIKLSTLYYNNTSSFPFSESFQGVSSQCMLKHYENVRTKYRVPSSLKIAIVHARESGWTGSVGVYHDFRNCDIRSYYSSISYLIDQGYFVVRIGDQTMKPVDADLFNGLLIDLPFNSECEQGDDVRFISNCDLYLGQSSGPITIAELCGRNIFCVNEAIQPMYRMFSEGGSWIVTLMKERILGDGRKLSLREILESEFYYYTEEWRNNGVTLVDNDEVSILEAIKDFHHLISSQPSIQKSKYEELNEIKEGANVSRLSRGLPRLLSAGDSRVQLSPLNSGC